MATPGEDPKLVRLRALFAMSEERLSKDPNDAEGLNAQNKAMRMMIRHSIDKAVLERADLTQRPRHMVYPLPPGPYGTYRCALVMVIARTMGGVVSLQVWQAGKANSHHVVMTGYPSDLDIVVFLANLLLTQLDRAIAAERTTSKHYQSLTPGQKRKYITSFIQTWTAVISGRLRRAYWRAQAGTNPDTADAALAVVNHRLAEADALMQQLKADMFGDKEPDPPVDFEPENNAGMVAGLEAATRADLGQKTVTAQPPARRALGFAAHPARKPHPRSSNE